MELLICAEESRSAFHLPSAVLITLWLTAAVNGSAWITGLLGNILSYAQSGRARYYVAFVAVGLLILVGVLISL